MVFILRTCFLKKKKINNLLRGSAMLVLFKFEVELDPKDVQDDWDNFGDNCTF